MSSGHHNDDHHSMEPKSVSFTVPFFLAAAFILAVVLFLSLCDPKPHHAGAEGHEHEGAATEVAHHEVENATTATENEDSMSVETTVPNVEPTHH